MKLALVTIVNGASFGNRLQNYATQLVLEKMGHEVETLDCSYQKSSLFKMRIKKILGSLPIKKFLNKVLCWKRLETFRAWDKQFIHYSKFRINPFDDKRKIEKILDDYEYFVVGSDQIWNPKFSSNSGYELLSFAAGRKRVALSTSIGLDHLPEQYRDLYVAEWKKFKAISVREDSAAELIFRESGVMSEVLIDPTMMIDKSEWEEFQEKPPLELQEKYLVSFFLTELSQKLSAKIEKFAAENGLKVYSLSSESRQFENLTPNHFIYIVSHSSYVITDSFHCTIFALLFQRPIYVFDRFDNEERVSSRLKTLLKKFGKEKSWFTDWENRDLVFDDVKYSIEATLKNERLKVDKYIREHII